jgi:hypothetical protein
LSVPLEFGGQGTVSILQRPYEKRVTHSSCFDGVNKYGHFGGLGCAFFSPCPSNDI